LISALKIQESASADEMDNKFLAFVVLQGLFGWDDHDKEEDVDDSDSADLSIRKKMNIVLYLF
jgi:hypothetical protein